MKIAYLITAHNQPGHLHRLVEALNTSNASFFIHLDAKSDLKEFHPENYPNNVKFIDNRVRVTHGGFALLQGMINLIKTAFNAEDFDYFQFLSGWDYPIKSPDYINKFLTQSYPTNFMNFYPLTRSSDFADFVRKYYFIDTIGNSPPFIRTPLKAVQYLFNKTSLARTFVPGLIPYRGSSWFCINILTVTYIINFLGTDIGRKLLNFYKHSACSDEMFFQTIVLNSPLAEYCRLYKGEAGTSSRNENKAYLHYIDWDPKRENPAVFDENDFQTLMDSPALYARKFTESKSFRLLDMIDHQIRGIATEDNSSHPIQLPVT